MLFLWQNLPAEYQIIGRMTKINIYIIDLLLDSIP